MIAVMLTKTGPMLAWAPYPRSGPMVARAPYPRSALRVLEPRAGAALTVLLALLLACVAGEEAGALQGRAQGRVVLLERARESVADRARLAGVAAAGHGHVEVEVPEAVDGLQRVEHVQAQDLAREVVLDRAAADLDGPGCQAPADSSR